MRCGDALVTGAVVLLLCAALASPAAGAVGYGSPDHYLSVGDDPWALTSGDIDADGDTDLLTGNFNDSAEGVSVFVGVGNGIFNPPTTYMSGANPETMALGKLDAGSDPDIVVGTSAKASVLLGAAGSLFGGTNFYGNWIGQTRGTGTGDFNGDGKIDIVMAEDEDKLVFLKGQGDGTFPTQKKSKVGPGGAGEIDTGKLNGDKRSDVVVAGEGNKGLLVKLGHKGKRGFGKARHFKSLPNAVHVVLGDVNGDGDKDIVISGGREAKRGGAAKGAVSVLLGKGNGRFAKPKLTTLGNATVTGLAVGDLDGDGKPDAAVGKYNGKLLIMPGRGNGRFGSPKTLDTGLNGARNVIAAKLNADSKPDLAVTNGGDNQITVFLHN
jgi:hypothetical protein